MTESLQILLHRLIDYAGLFPPACLSMKDSVEKFKAYRGGEHAEMLNRFVLPAAQLAEFLVVLQGAHDGSEWELSAVVGPDAETDIAGVIEFNRHIAKDGAQAVVRSIEIKAGDPQAIGQYQGLIPKSVDAYFEISAGDVDDWITALADAEAYAKLRTGGETADMFPSCAEVAHLLAACAFDDVPFKCTGGLHHAIRGTYPVTQEPAPLTTAGASQKMHGFLNVFVAAALAQKGAAMSDLEAILAEESAEALKFGRSGIRWRDYTVSNNELSSARSTFGISFGSSSFTEPLDDLRKLGLL